MNTPTIVVAAKRVITHMLNGPMIMMIYSPNKATINALRAHDRGTPINPGVHIDISDETGEYTTGATWIIDKLTISEDDKTIVLVLTK